MLKPYLNLNLIYLLYFIEHISITDIKQIVSNMDYLEYETKGSYEPVMLYELHTTTSTAVNPFT